MIELPTKPQHFKPVQVERISRRQNNCKSKIEIYFVKG